MGVKCYYEFSEKNRRNLNETKINNSIEINENIFLFDTKEENIAFPKGEHRFQLIKDSNRISLEERIDNLSEKVELFFSLINNKEPNNICSFRISIINNKRTGIETFLGDIEGTGENIEFGNSFKVDYFFERVQIVIIEPKINGKGSGEKKQFNLCNLMTDRNGKISIDIENIGTLEIKQKRVEN